MSARHSLQLLGAKIEACTACSRLVRYRERVAREKRKAYRDETYWGRPVAGFGDARARIVVCGLAPGAHGANRTGRVFTGDRSGDFLYAALHRGGLASQPTSTRAGDGLALRGVYITLAARCAPPDNAPSRIELTRCARWLDAELPLLEEKRVFLALGSIAFAAILRYKNLHDSEPRPPKFGHGVEMRVDSKTALLASYHVSQQNTQTGKLTEAMFDKIIARAKELADYT